ncbi:MAG: hypothetical protein ACM31G_02410, partial [Flavobacteriales bacterium]
TPGKRMATRTVRPSFGTVVTPSFPLSFKKEENTSYIDSIRNGPAENYWGRVTFGLKYDLFKKN